MASVSAIFSHKCHLLLIQYKAGFSEKKNTTVYGWELISLMVWCLTEIQFGNSCQTKKPSKQNPKRNIVRIILHNYRVSVRQGSSISLIFPWFLIHFLWLSTARKCPSEGCCMFCLCSHLHILLLTRKMQQPVKGTFHTMYSCSVLIGNTTQFKSHNDSQNLWLYFVKTTTQRESISRNAGKKNNKYCHTCTAVWNTETLTSVTRSYRKIT